MNKLPKIVVPQHIAWIPDGNRRKAARDGISIEDAYLLGAAKGVEVVGWCRELGVKHWTGFASSHENILKRAPEEFLPFFSGGLQFCREMAKIPSITLHIFGDIAGISAAIPSDWKDEVLELQRQGRPEGEFVVHVGINYSATADLVALANNARRNHEDIMAVGLNDLLLSAGIPDVELLVRPGGKRRLSGFLPYQLRYAEFYFLRGLWADFSRADFDRALKWFARQDRNFGE